MIRVLLLLFILAFLAASAYRYFSVPSASPVTLKPVTPSASPAPLRPGTAWFGTLKVTYLKGSGPLKKGITDIHASIRSTDNGSVYFEIIEGSDWESTPILSTAVRIQDDRLIPESGEADWLFRIVIDNRDAEGLTFTFSDGKLISEGYVYNDGQQQGKLSFWLYPAD